MKLYAYYFFLPMCIFCTHYSMNSPTLLNMMHAKELQQAIKEDSVEKFLSFISTQTGKNRLKAFRSALAQNAFAITHHIPADLKNQLLVLSARRGSRSVAKFLTQLPTYHYCPLTDYAFSEALKTKHFKIAMLLLDKGANINQRVHNHVCGKMTLLHYFILENFQGSFTPVIKWLLKHGADPDLVSSESDVPLQDAEEDLPIIELLCDHGVDPNIGDDVGDLALTIFCGGLLLDSDGIKSIVQLLAAGTDINSQNSDGKTALHRAAQANNIKAALILLHYGASKEIIDNDKKIPSDYIRTNKMHLIFNSCPLAPLPKAARKAQLAIQKKKIKIV